MRFTRVSLIVLAGFLLLAATAQNAAGFDLCGYDWTYKTNPMDEDYYINPNCVDSSAGTDQEQIDAVNRSFTEWNTTGGACFDFTYGGTSSGTSVTYNNQNLIHWDTTPPDGGGYIAANYHWVSGSNMSESDIVFNDQSYTWNSTGTPTTSQMDVENIATHELGHTLCLGDLYSGADSSKTMYGYAGSGETYKRTLHPDDIAGIQDIYGVCSDCTDDGYEENDSFGTATAISAGTITGLQICAGDQDYFSFSVPDGYSVQVDIAFTHADGNLSLYLNDPSFAMIDSSVTTTDNESVSATGLAAGTYYAVVAGVSSAENSYSLTLTLIASGDTMHTEIGCVPASGTLPYTLQLWPQLCNDDWFTRRLHGKINVTIANGTTYYNWRAGSTNIAPGNCYNTPFGVNLPDVPGTHGTNTFTLIGTDITAPPYNQPPYSPSGDTDVDSCTTVGN